MADPSGGELSPWHALFAGVAAMVAGVFGFLLKLLADLRRRNGGTVPGEVRAWKEANDREFAMLREELARRRERDHQVANILMKIERRLAVIETTLRLRSGGEEET